MSDIFLSYSQKDRVIARLLAQKLIAKGWSVWWDEGVRSGTPFDRAIELQIMNAKCVVVLWSRRSVDSQWVRAEAALALRRNKLISVSVETDLDLPLQFTHIHTIEIFDLGSAGEPKKFPLLVRDIGELIGSRAQDASPPAESADSYGASENQWLHLPKGDWSTWRYVIGGAVILILVFIFILRSDDWRRGAAEPDKEEVASEQSTQNTDLDAEVAPLPDGNAGEGNVFRPTDDLRWELVASAGKWKPRHGHSTVSFNGELWLLGGHEGSNSPGSFFNDVWHSKDGKEWKLATESAPWAARNFHTSVVHDGKIWVLGGVNVTVGQGYAAFNDVWYSSDGREWELATDAAPWSPRWSHTSVVHNGRIWVIGGCNLQDGSSGAPLNRGASEFVDGRQMWQGGLRDVWSSTNGRDWVQVTDNAQWPYRWGHTSVAYSGQIWVIGGYSGERHLNDVWYSGNGRNWRDATRSALWSPRSYHTAAAAGQRLWIIGGSGGEIDVEAPLEGSTLWSSADGREWTFFPRLPTGLHRRAFHSTAVHADKIWILGGSPSSDNYGLYNNEVWSMSW